LCPIVYPIRHQKTLPEREYEVLFFSDEGNKKEGVLIKKLVGAGKSPVPALFETPEQKPQKD
jgi:hypothetical protein